MYWLHNLLGIVKLVAQRQRSYLGLVAALVAGFIVAVALVVSIPLYADAVGYRTLRAWDIRIDEALFLGGLEKGNFLKVFGADIFFDDQRGHCESARLHVATGHVPFGIANENKDGA